MREITLENLDSEVEMGFTPMNTYRQQPETLYFMHSKQENMMADLELMDLFSDTNYKMRLRMYRKHGKDSVLGTPDFSLRCTGRELIYLTK